MPTKSSLISPINLIHVISWCVMDAASPSYCIVRWVMVAKEAPLSNRARKFFPFNSTCTGVFLRLISTYPLLSSGGTAHATGEGVICYMCDSVYLISC